MRDTIPTRGASEELSVAILDYLEKTAKMTHVAIADVLKVHKSFVSRVKSGERVFKLGHLPRLAIASRLTVAELLERVMPTDLKRIPEHVRASHDELQRSIDEMAEYASTLEPSEELRERYPELADEY